MTQKLKLMVSGLGMQFRVLYVGRSHHKLLGVGKVAYHYYNANTIFVSCTCVLVCGYLNKGV